jgi:hypothetical protein
LKFADTPLCQKAQILDVVSTRGISKKQPP